MELIIRIRSHTYQCINMFGKYGPKQGEFNELRGMAVDTSGTIYVTGFVKRGLVRTFINI